MNLHSNTKPKPSNYFSHNLKILRKKFGYSQEVLAGKLGIKRSNIAVYESKNVEPRLRIILEMAKLFDINLQSLIQEKLDPNKPYLAFNKKQKDIVKNEANSLRAIDQTKFAEFISKSEKIKKVLEGFKAFYAFKKDQLKGDIPYKEKLMFDIDNFLQLMEHLLIHNESIIKAITDASNQKVD